MCVSLKIEGKWELGSYKTPFEDGLSVCLILQQQKFILKWDDFEKLILTNNGLKIKSFVFAYGKTSSTINFD